MDRELTFHPESERTRDLIYSEYSSCDRSLHLLVQENFSVPYEVLLRIYRETVSAYLSSTEIRTPADFFGHLISRFDRIWDENRLPAENLPTLSVHILLRSVDALYLATSRETDVFARVNEELVPLTDWGAAQRLSLDAGGAQQELFPHRASDVFSSLKLDPAKVNERDLVLGCPPGEKSAVLETLLSPVWIDAGAGGRDRAARRSVVSKFVSRKILVVRFGELVPPPGEEAPLRAAFPRRFSALGQRRVLAVAVGALVVAILIGVLWRKEPAGPAPRTDAGVVAETGSGADRKEAVAEGAADRTREARPEQLVLVEVWRGSYSEPVTSSPAIAAGLVVFGCRDGRVYATVRETGEPSWNFAATGGVGASPAVLGERLVVADYNGWVYALTTRTGSEIWKRKLPAKIVSSPDVLDDRVLVGCLDGYAYCLSAVDGNVYWKRKTNGRIRGSPASAGGAFFVPSYDGFLYALSAPSGELMWRSSLGGPVSSSPAVSGGAVVVGAEDGTVRCFDAATGRSLWSSRAATPVKSSVAIAGGRVFVGSNGGELLCLNLADGALRWTHTAGGAVLARPLVRNGIVYVGSYDGRFYALDAATGRELGTFEAGAEIFSSAAADEDRIYFGTNGGTFFCLDRRTGASS